MARKIEIYGTHRFILVTEEEYIDGWIDNRINHFLEYRSDEIDLYDLPTLTDFITLHRRNAQETFAKYSIEID
jgi:hypothetical protein